MASVSSATITPLEPDSPLPFRLQLTPHSLSTIPSNSVLVHSTNCFGTWGAGVALAIHDLFPNADKVYASHCDSFRPDAASWPAREGLVGQALLIPPQRGDTAKRDNVEGRGVWIACLFTSYGYGRPTKRKAGLDTKGLIRAQTESALRDLRRQLEMLSRGEVEIIESGEKKGESMRVLKKKEEEAGRSANARKRKREDGGRGEEKMSIQINDDSNKNDANTQVIDGNENMGIYSPLFNSGAFGIKWEETKTTVEEIFQGWDGKWFTVSPPTT